MVRNWQGINFTFVPQSKIEMKKLILSILVIATALTAQAQLKAFTISYPEKVLPGVKKIAIMKFQNSGVSNYYYWYNDQLGENFPNYMTSELLDENRGLVSAGLSKWYRPNVKMNQYTVVERSQLDNIIKEQQLGASGAVADNEAAQVGKLLGLDAIVSGTYKWTNAGDKYESKAIKNKEGQVTGYSHTVTRSVIVESTMKVISVETGEVLAVTTKSRTMTSKKSSATKSKAYAGLTSVEILRDNGIKQLASDLVNYFAPRYASINYDLDKIKVKTYKERAKDAVDAAKSGDVAKALGIYKAIQKEDSYNPRLAYNLGLVYEAVLDYDNAVKLHKAASSMDDKKSYKMALDRASSALEAVNQLKASGWVIESGDVSAASEEGISAATVEKVTTRGKSKDRVKVYTEPMKQGDIAAQVPGGLEFEVLGKEGPFVKIKLATGDEGYIHQDDVK